MYYVELGKTGVKVSEIGLGTYGIGGWYWTMDLSNKDYYIYLIRKAIELGINLIDTAEMYGGGGSEIIIGEAIKVFKRDEIFIISKVWPTHLRYDDVIKAAKRSVERLGTYIDLYLIHAPNPEIPLRETLRAMEKLVDMGLIRYIGVSNFDLDLMIQAQHELSKYELVANEVEYSLLCREIELDLLPYAKKEKIAIIAYSPLARGLLAKEPYITYLKPIAMKYNKTPIQVALNFLITMGTIPIPKSAKIEHLVENVGAMGWRLGSEDIELINRYFPVGKCLYYD